MVAVLGLNALGLWLCLIKWVSAAVLFTATHCPAKNRETYGYAIEYVAIIAGHIRRSEKARIYGKGAEMYKSIYKKGTQRR